jgi:hypothetical protein
MTVKVSGRLQATLLGYLPMQGVDAGILVVQDHIEQGTVDGQAAVVMNKA